MSVPAENLFNEDDETVKIVEACLRESQEAKKDRIELNRINREAYNNQQDWSHKIEGQSREFLPKTAETVEQFAAFLKRGLTQFGDWFSVRQNSPLADESVRRLMRCYLDRMPADDNTTTSFGEIVSDAGKVGLLESMMIFKVHGTTKTTKFFVEEGDVIEKDHWQLQVDLVSPDNFDVDPSGKGLYEIHTVNRDLHHVQQLAEQGIYDAEAVAEIKTDFEQAEEEKRKDKSINDARKAKPTFRRNVMIREFWGTLLNFDGSVKKKNVLVTIANDQYVLRETDFPFWHGESPFVRIPLMRVPFSVWHRALYDQVVPLNFALNEMFNLMLDGGLAAVWGIKQLRMDLLEDPRQVADGIPQGKTLAIREDVPDGMKVLEQVTEGVVPQDAMAMFELLDREFNSSALSNEIRQGILPAKQVRACTPLDSEILTAEGWKTYDQLVEGESVLSYNTETGENEWVPLQAVSVFKDAEVYEYSLRSFKVRCTYDHKWVQRTHWDKYNKTPKGEELSPFLSGPGQTEFRQSAKAPDGPGLEDVNQPWQMLDRPELPNLVMQMTSQERKGFIMGLLAGDGTRTVRKGAKGSLGQVCLSQMPGPTADAFRLACTLEGIATNQYFPNWNVENHNRQSYGPNGIRVSTAWRISLLHGQWRSTRTMQMRQVENEDVWCPTTRNGTWVMRQGNTITITGNTEVVEATQSSAVVLDSIVGNIERRLEDLLRKSWLTIAQNADDLLSADVQDAMSQQEMILFASMTPRQRFGMFAQGCTFKVHGLSATLAKARDFQRIMALLQVGQTSPLIAPAMMRRWSPDKLLTHLTKIMNLNPENLERTDEDQPIESDVALFRQIGQVRPGEEQVSAEATGEPGLPSEISAEGLGSVSSGL